MNNTYSLVSSRFGPIEVPEGDIIHFERGLIGLGGRRYVLLAPDPESSFRWLHSLDDPTLALPVTNPWTFFPGYVVDVGDAETAQLGVSHPAEVEVWVTVRASREDSGFCANLRAPIVVAAGRGRQIINEAPDADVRAQLFPQAAAAAQAA